ncbi:PepSY domain-containing protein [Hymenobacter aerilatus]|uniref:PepSY domain-containing protein n=1 Tax=Hymenobacter aerilatus TaxID=2932251 RepID=A0A8T9SX59_9BACT|nr:PepSY-associated TM helix domain-containing protein [Hymenobacter aerilatus]UOR06425.1 PepSY domain-containing protein [Hymenobacter aerilatus]
MKTEKNGYTLRKFILDIHLWLGVGSGLILFIVCLSGTLYTFRNEIVQAVEAQAYHVTPPATGQPLPAATLVSRLEQAYPASKVVGLGIPADAERAWTFSLTTREALARQLAEEKAEQQAGGKPGGEGHKRGGKEGRGGKGGKRGNQDSQTLLVNPYTAAVQGNTETGVSEFFRSVMGLHRWLLIEGGVGQLLVGSATLIFIVLQLTGLALWAPAKLKQWSKWKMWRPGFVIKTNASPKRLNHDLHNTLGFYALGLLTVMSLTGLCWSFEWYRDGLSSVLGAKVFGGRGEKPLPSAVPATTGQTLSADDYLALANRQLAYPGDVRLNLPKGPEGSASVQKTKTGFFALAGTDRLTLDQYSGAVLKADIFAAKPFNEQLTSLIKPLHTGEVAGTFSKILYFLACLIATSLPITGVIIWLNKRQKSNRRPARRAAAPEAIARPAAVGRPA